MPIVRQHSSCANYTQHYKQQRPRTKRPGRSFGLDDSYQGSCSSSMILSTTPGAGLYFASSPRSLLKSVSFSGYGRYSSTSRPHFDALLIPASSNAAASSERVALLAESAANSLSLPEESEDYLKEQ